MISIRNRWSRVALALVLSASLPAHASAQSQLNSSEATDFIGNWTITFESPQAPAPVSIGVRITDMSGKVGAVASIAEIGETPITNITRSGPGLVLRYTLDVQGMPINVGITIGPAAEAGRFTATLDFADGAFTQVATATKEGG